MGGQILMFDSIVAGPSTNYWAGSKQSSSTSLKDKLKLFLIHCLKQRHLNLLSFPFTDVMVRLLVYPFRA